MEAHHAIYVRVPPDLLRKLREIGEREFRSPKEQASVLLIEAVERRLSEIRAAEAEQARAR